MTTVPQRFTPSTDLVARLVGMPDLVRVVRELPNETFTALVREIGVEDAGELVALATTEQLVAAFDEDLFVGDRPGEREVFDRKRFVTWLEVLLEAGDQAVARRMTELSEGFVAHALSNIVLVFDYELLRGRLTSDDPAAEGADKALESALNEEIDGYLLVAREEEGWDAVLALVLALDRDHRSVLVRVLDQCATLARDYLDDLDALTEALSATESLAEDVEAEREERRSRLGYVEPRAAKSFLSLAGTPMRGDLANEPRDPITVAHYRHVERATTTRAASGAGAVRRDDTLRKALAGLPAIEPSPTDRPRNSAPHLAVALQELADGTSNVFDERLQELAYLSNVIVAGASIGDRRFRPAEAAQAALATVALGAELVARERRPDRAVPPTRAAPHELREAVRRCSADRLFRKAVSTVVGSKLSSDPMGLVHSREELEAILHELDTGSCPDHPGQHQTSTASNT